MKIKYGELAQLPERNIGFSIKINHLQKQVREMKIKYGELAQLPERNIGFSIKINHLQKQNKSPAKAGAGNEN